MCSWVNLFSIIKGWTGVPAPVQRLWQGLQNLDVVEGAFSHTHWQHKKNIWFIYTEKHISYHCCGSVCVCCADWNSRTFWCRDRNGRDRGLCVFSCGSPGHSYRWTSYHLPCSDSGFHYLCMFLHVLLEFMCVGHFYPNFYPLVIQFLIHLFPLFNPL